MYDSSTTRNKALTGLTTDEAEAFFAALDEL
jgi:hypothetical protein